MQKFLRYECNVQIESINAEQKRILKGRLGTVREWLGRKPDVL